MTIGAVVVTHNSEAHIEKCIESLKRERLPIVVVDSASTDGTKERLSRLDVETLLLSENRGFGYAVNVGVRKVNTDYVLFINPDAYLELGAMQGIVDFIQHHSKGGIIGLLLCNEAGNAEVTSFGDEPTLAALLSRHASKKGLPVTPQRVDWVSGGAMLIKKSLLEKLDGFDEGFFLYWEDVDLCKRARDAGWEIWIYPKARVFHVRGASQKSEKEKTRLYDASADRYYKKHYPTHIWHLQRLLRKIYRLVNPRAI